MKTIDWGTLADTLGAIQTTESGWSERGGTGLACEVLALMIGDDALRDSVDFYVSGQPGHELARSVLWLLGPLAAMERCREIFRQSKDEQEQADAIGLLKVVGDRRVLEWIPEFQASANPMVRNWTVGLIDQLLIMKGAITQDEAMPLLERALSDPDEAVRAQARQVLEMADEQAGFDAAAISGE